MTKAPWQRARLEVNTRARNVIDRIRETVFEDRGGYAAIAEQASLITSIDPEDIALLRVFTDLVYSRLPEDFRKALGVKLVHGLVQLTQHAWLTVEGEVENVHPDPAVALRIKDTMHPASVGPLVWRVVIDVHAIDIEPSTLMIVPTAPLYSQYQQQVVHTETISHAAELEAAKEGAADEDQQSLILKALMNKHA